MTSVSPLVSIVVPTLGRPGALARCLESLAAQTLPASAFEVIVVDDGSPAPVTLPPRLSPGGAPLAV